MSLLFRNEAPAGLRVRSTATKTAKKVKKEKMSEVPQRTGVRRHTIFWGDRFQPQKKELSCFP